MFPTWPFTLLLAYLSKKNADEVKRELEAAKPTPTTNLQPQKIVQVAQSALTPQTTPPSAYTDVELIELGAILGLDPRKEICAFHYQCACFNKAIALCDNNQEADWHKIDGILKFLDRLRLADGQTLFSKLVCRSNPIPAQAFLKRYHKHGIIYEVEKSSGNNALHLAAIHGHAELVKQLQDCISTTTENNAGKTPIDLTIEHGHKNVLAAFGAGAQQAYILPRLSRVLFVAAESGHTEIIRQLLLTFPKEGINTLTQIVDGQTILHVIIEKLKYHTLEYLLTAHWEFTQRLLSIYNAQGYLPIHLACKKGDPRLVHLLVAAGAGLESYTTTKVPKKALNIAIDYRHPEVIDALYYLGAQFAPVATCMPSPDTNFSPVDTRCHALVDKYYLANIQQKKSPPNYCDFPAENLVFQGGGPRGVAYVGALKVLHQRGILQRVIRVAGTSAGAITAGLVATGHTTDEIESLLVGKSLVDFLDFRDPSYKKLNNIPKSNGILDGLQKVLGAYWGGGKAILNPIQRAHEIYQLFSELPGLCKGDEFLIWIESQIQQKTAIPYCTFGELQALAKKKPAVYKELFVYTIQYPGGLITCLSADNNDFKDVVISDAIRCSMSIPGVFAPHKLYYKATDGTRYYRGGDTRSFIDGGLFKNFPLDAFDDNRYQSSKGWGMSTNKRTLGLALSDQAAIAKIPSKVRPPTVADLINGYYCVEEILRKADSYTLHRVISIPVKDVGLLDFDLKDEKKKSLLQAGMEAIDRSTLLPKVVPAPKPNNAIQNAATAAILRSRL